MIQLHHLTNSRSQRIIWLLEELGLEYDLIIHERDPHTRQAANTLYQVHPLGKAPVLIANTIQLAESGAIVDYLLEVYGSTGLIPPAQSPEKIHYIYWKNFAEASLMPYLAMTQLFAKINQRAFFPANIVLRAITKKVNQHYLHKNLQLELNLIEQHLSQHTWFAGEQFSAADILMGFMLDALAGRFVSAQTHPHIDEFVERTKQRPAYQRAAKKGQWSPDEFDRYGAHLHI